MLKNDKQLVKGQKNSAALPNNPNASSNKMKQGTTARPNAHIDIDVFNYWLDNLDYSSQEAFRSFVEDNNSVIESYLYARFLGYTESIVGCDLWIQANYTKPDHRETLLYEIEEMQQDISKLREAIEDGIVKRDAGVARIASMQKELRGAIAQIETFNSVRDRKGLLMAGADRAIRELMFIFKDDPIEAPLQEASMSVWARMQLEE